MAAPSQAWRTLKCHMSLASPELEHHLPHLLRAGTKLSKLQFSGAASCVYKKTACCPASCLPLGQGDSSSGGGSCS